MGQIQINPVRVIYGNHGRGSGGKKIESMAFERQRRRRVTTLVQRCSEDGWRRRQTKLSHRRVTTYVGPTEHCSDMQRLATSGDDVGPTLFRQRLHGDVAGRR